jgi:predicted nucleotidyltransferase component of viral defense system
LSQEKYKKTVNLLLEILPFALKDNRVALKGGTAINLFHRDFPRLSVDIDLCYLPLEDRITTFNNLHLILSQIKDDLENNLGLKVNVNNPLDGKREAKLVAKKQDIEVKIEPNFTLRSSLFSAVELDLSPKASKEFKKSIQARCLNIADTYGGKFCAALDRQHPRDLFDVKFLLENEGITTDVKDSFLFYLISHGRPINELLNPNFKDISKEYSNEFLDMAKVNVKIDELVTVRENLVIEIKKSLTENDKKFLLSFVSNEPDWTLVRDSKIKGFPSVQWKIMNQKKMSPQKVIAYVKSLSSILN